MREQGSQPVDVSLITESGGFSLGLSIPRGAESVMESPVGAAARGKCQSVGA